ncbi:MAG: recombination regulator RecX [Clostridiales bacterium]|nr:recombination regulator RecX [Clostridiales bacterium]
MKLTTEPGKGGKLRIYCDGEYVASVDLDTWYSMNYFDGSEIDSDELAELKTSIDNRLAYARALRYLTLRAHSEGELYNKLLTKHSAESAQYAIEKCGELGFLDDVDFARRFASELAQNKHYGVQRIKNELYAKGIDRSIINDTVSELDFDFVESIKKVIEKKYYSNLFDEKGRGKIIAALMRLGHNYSDIKTALSCYPETEADENEC